MTESTRQVLLNREVIAVDQDSLGKQGTRQASLGDVEIWTRPLADGGFAVGIFNRGGTQADVRLRADDFKLKGSTSGRDLWLHRNMVFDHGIYLAGSYARRRSAAGGCSMSGYELRLEGAASYAMHPLEAQQFNEEGNGRWWMSFRG